MKFSAYLIVMGGGALGSLLRYVITQASITAWGSAFPWGTILINILGSFVIGFFGELTLPNAALPASTEVRLFVMVGICGGFTTFSSFSLQTVALLREGDWIGALTNVALSVLACVAAVGLGLFAAQRCTLFLRG